MHQIISNSHENKKLIKNYPRSTLIFIFSGKEVLKNTVYTIWLKMVYIENSVPMETPWGGGGVENILGEDGTRFKFTQNTMEGVRSSVQCGQIPLLFYI